jgi:hypothetical protein
MNIIKISPLKKIVRTYNSLVGKPYINIPKNAFIQFITEDKGFTGRVYDLKGKTNRNISCKPLTFERTKNKNPAEKYTGVFEKPIILNPEIYEELLNATKKNLSTSISKIISQANNGSELKDIDSLVENEFIKIVPENASSSIEFTNGFFMRRQADSLSSLIHANKFNLEEYPPSMPRKNIKIQEKNSQPEVIYDKRKLFDYINIEQRLLSSQKNKLRRKIGFKKTLIEEDFISINQIIREYIGKNSQINIKTKSETNNRQDLLNRHFNPTVIPDSEQILFVEYLNDPSIGLVSFIAPQGAGKTYFALAAGLHQVKQGLYDNIIYLRPAIETGPSTGFIPGDSDKKNLVYMKSCEDSLEKIFSLHES